MKMMDNLLTSPLFWISFYLTGYVTSILILALFGIERIERRIPRYLLRILIFLIFVLPPIVFPFTEGPKIGIASIAALFIGAFLTGTGILIRIVAQKQIGVSPALKGKVRLVTMGIYGSVRHPLYFGNGLFAVGMAFLFDSLYAFLFSIVYIFLYLPIIYFEEKDLLRKYGKEYDEYRKKVPWKLIPKLF